MGYALKGGKNLGPPLFIRLHARLVTVGRSLRSCNQSPVRNEFTLRQFLDEDQLRRLMLSGLRGDAGAYRQLLAALVGDLRSFFRHRIALGADEIEDLVQETLLAIHAKRETYDA